MYSQQEELPLFKRIVQPRIKNTNSQSHGWRSSVERNFLHETKDLRSEETGNDFWKEFFKCIFGSLTTKPQFSFIILQADISAADISKISNFHQSRWINSTTGALLHSHSHSLCKLKTEQTLPLKTLYSMMFSVHSNHTLLCPCVFHLSSGAGNNTFPTSENLSIKEHKTRCDRCLHLSLFKPHKDPD